MEPAYRQALSRIAVLEELSKQADSISRDGSLDSGFHALQAADFANAKAKFEEVLVAVTPQLRLASIAAYGLGLVAEDNVDWITAAKCFQLSCTYCPDENNLLKSSIYLWRAGFYEDAASVSLELRRVFAQKYGESSEQYAGVLNNLGAQFYELGRTNEAIELFEKSLHIRRKLKSDVSIDFAAGLANLGNIHVKTGHLKKALQLHRQALKVGLKAGIQNDERYSAMLNGVAETFRLNQMFRKSEIYFRRALKVDAETVGTQHPFYARDLHFYAKLLMETNRLNLANEHLEKALVILKVELGLSYPHTLHVLSLLLYVLGKQKRSKAAKLRIAKLKAELQQSSSEPSSVGARAKYFWQDVPGIIYLTG